MKRPPHEMSRRQLGRAGLATLAAIAAPTIVTRSARANQTLTVMSWGGDYHQTFDEVFAKPFGKDTGIEVTLVDNGDLAKVKAQVQSGSVQWDVIDAPPAFATAGSKDGLWEALDPDILKIDGLVNAGARDYVPYYMYAGGILWDEKRTPEGKHPTDFAGFWDTARYPGRRILRTLVYDTLEMALIADGVAPRSLYPLDVERAFKALDRIKPNVSKWASSTPEQVSLVVQNEGDFSYSYFNRVKGAQKSGAPLGFSFAQTVISLDNLTVTKGTANREAAMRFVAACLKPERQAEWATRMFYIPNVKQAIDIVKASPAKDYLPDLASEKNAVANAEWWGQNYTALQKRYTEWLIS